MKSNQKGQDPTMLCRAKKMRNINEVMLSGNTVGVPTVREYNGTKYADVTIASNRKAYQDEKGGWQSGTDYIPVSLSGKMAERIENLPKGSEIVLRGYIESYNYKKDDKTVRALRVHAVEIISVQPKKDAKEKTDLASTLPF